MVPRLKHQPGGAVFAEAADFVLLEDAEGFGRVIRALHVGGVEDVAQLVARKAIGARVEGVEFGAQLRAAILVPFERRAVIA
jgi:hypothetical protein